MFPFKEVIGTCQIEGENCGHLRSVYATTLRLALRSDTNTVIV